MFEILVLKYGSEPVSREPLAREEGHDRPCRVMESRVKQFPAGFVSQTAIDSALVAYRLDAIIAPTNSPAWKIDLINGDNWGKAVSSSMLSMAGFANPIRCS